jgi:flagellin-like protein
MRGVSAIVSVVLLIAIVILAAAGLYFWIGGIITEKDTSQKAIVITATVLNAANGTVAIVVLDGTLTGQYLNTSDGTLCDFGESVTLMQGSQDTCTMPPHEGTVTLFGAQVGATSVTMTPNEVSDITMQGSGSSQTWSQSSAADFAGGSFNNTGNGTVILNGTQVGTFRINTNPVTDETNPVIAFNSSGDFVMAWNNRSGNMLYKLFWANTSVRTSDINVTVTQSTTRTVSSIASDTSGNFVIGMADFGGGGKPWVRPFFANGSARANEIQANTTSSSADTMAGVHPDNADFVTVWEDGGPATLGAKVFFANGTNSTNSFVVNDFGQADRFGTDMDSSGNYVIAWRDTSGVNVSVKTYWANNSVRKAQTVINDGAGASQYNTPVGFDSSGNYVVAWVSGGVRAKIFFSNDTNRTGPFSVDGSGDFLVVYPSLAVESNGDFIVAGMKSPATFTVYAIRYFANGTNKTGPFQVGGSGSGTDNTVPTVAIDSSGNYVVAWQEKVGSFWHVHAKYYWNNNSIKNETMYNTSGTYLSEIRDASSNSTSFNGTFTATEVKPNNTDITYTLFFSNFSNFATNTSEGVTNPDSSISQTSRFVRYRATLTTSDIMDTPRITRFSLSYGAPFSLTYTVNFASGIGWVYLNKTCPDGNNTFVDGPRNLGGATFFSATLSNLITECNYTSFANTSTGGVIGVQTFDP